jgi:hypothetical protein
VSRPLQLTSWKAHVAERFADFPAAVAAVLAVYSFGLILAHASGLATVVLFLARHLATGEHALRKRLREFYLDAADKSGCKRRDFAVASAFAPLLRWILSLWDGQHLALAIDVTNLGERFHVLCISVMVRGLAIPVAWKVLLGGVKEPWHPHWCALLAALKPAVPAGWTVVVLSDRGLESPALFAATVALGWHPLMRVKRGGSFRPDGWGRFHPLAQLAGRVGVSLAASGLAYSGTRMRCTLLARWEEGYAEPWLVLTDLPPESASAVWYGLRTWIEQGFKLIKGGGWKWDRTRMEDPERVERLWLVLAVASLWVVAVGAEEEVQEEHRRRMRQMQRQLTQSARQAQDRQQAEQRRQQRQHEALQARRQRLEKRQQAKAAKQAAKAKAVRHAGAGATALRRAHRVSVRGLAVLQATWTRSECTLPKHLHPEPWPADAQTATPLNEQDFLAHQT